MTVATVCIRAKRIRRRRSVATWERSLRVPLQRNTSGKCNSSNVEGRVCEIVSYCRCDSTASFHKRQRSGSAAANEDVNGALAVDVFVDFVAERVQVDPVKEVLAFAQEHGPQREVHLINRARTEILLHGGHAATDAHVLLACCLPGSFQRRFDPIGYEVERGAALHLEGLARMVREHEGGNVVW